ncbi:MAG: DUF4405 domain-containing protein [Desulfurococcales archaeon]|nr:DUF4405 domain-containing protein [Desulfurococcales archaeon]
MREGKLLVCYLNFMALLVTWVISLVTGVVLWIVLPSGGGRAGPAAFSGFRRSEWVSIHLASSLAFSVLACVHLVLNWGWVASVTKYITSRGRKRSK